VQSPVPKAAEKPLFGFGLGKPPSQPQSQSPVQTPQPAPATSTPFSLFNKLAPSTPATAPAAPPSLFGKPQPAPAAAAPATPSVNPPTPKAADGKFAIPARTPVKESPQAQDDGSRQMASVMQRMITDLVSEIKTVSHLCLDRADE
jgi:hypothetical protein